MAVAHRASEDGLKTFLREYPDAAREKESDGFLLLHVAFVYQASEDVVKTLLAEYTDAAREKASNGCLPLHVASPSRFVLSWEAYFMLQ